MHAMPTTVPLIIPVENQVRELDPKLLLAYVAAKRGFETVIGSHRLVDFQIASFPKSVYLNKSFTIMNLKMLKIIKALGHEIVAWDEEALVHLPADMYYSRRLSPVTLKYLSHLFAWGEDNAELWHRYPHMPESMPIHITGNPRSDLLRPELKEFYRHEVETLRRDFGEFILINTNFNHVNAFYPSQNLFTPVKASGGRPEFGKAARGMTREFAETLRDHKQTILNHFTTLIPMLEKQFPKVNIVVRPHPTENQKIYREIAAGCSRVCISNEGNVVPWLMAAKALVHNGCTTGVEAYAMRVPSISYRISVNETIDEGFYRLPNRLSYQAFTFEELKGILSEILAGARGTVDDAACGDLFKRYMAAQDGPLACERIVDVLERITDNVVVRQKPNNFKQVIGLLLANGRRFVKRIKTYLPGRHAPPEFHRHRYPGISLDELTLRISRFRRILGDTIPVKAEQIHDQVFRISSQRN
jgi:surface carbohydrate biosynthesis protein